MSRQGGDYSIPNLPVRKPDVDGKHPLRNVRNHDLLLQYLLARLDAAKSVRDAVIDRYIHIDREISGWFEPSDADDEKRIQIQKRKGVPTAVQVKVPLVNFYLRNTLSFLMGVFAPRGEMFNYIGDKEQQEIGNKLIKKMNRDAQFADYYNQILRTCWNLMKYNIGGFETFWDQELGPRFTGDDAAPVVQRDQVIWQGNRLLAINPYNTLVDPYVRLDELHKRGEFAAQARRISSFDVLRDASQGFFFNTEGLISEDGTATGLRNDYYRHPPTEANIFPRVGGSGADINWMQFTGLANPTVYADLSRAVEEVTMYCWIVPAQFGLSAEKTLQIWKFTILGGTRIVNAVRQGEAHGWLPINMAYGEDDLLESSQKSLAELIEPFQSYVSYLLNTHIKNTRKKLYGTTFYDANATDLRDIPQGEVAARIPVRTRGDRPVRDFIFQNQDTAQDSRVLMQDVAATLNLLENLFPQQALPSQIASIDRAVESQVATVLQGTTRKDHMLANQLDGTLMRPTRLMMYYNILEFGGTLDLGTGEQIQTQDIRDLDEHFVIGQGLKSIDKEIVQKRVRELITAILQSQIAVQEFDIVGLIDWWSDLMSVDTDLTQFRRQPQGAPQDDLPQQGTLGEPGLDELVQPQ